MIHVFRAPATLPAAKELPKRLLMARWGRNESTKGPVIVNEKTARSLPRLQQLAGFDEIALDFQHNTVPGSEAFKAEKEPRKVAAFGVAEVIPGEGLFLNIRRFTPEGEEALKNGHFPDVSPAVKFENDADNGVVIFAHSVAACRQGSITDLHTFSAEDPAKIREAIATFTSETTTHFPMKELLCLILGLDAKTATDEQISAGATTFTATINELKTFSAGVAELKGFMAGLGDLKNLGQSVGEIRTFTTQLTEAKNSLAALEKKFAQQERDGLVALAIRDGKVVPFGAEFDAMSNAQFKAVLDKLEAGRVPLEQRTAESVKTFTASGALTSPQQSADAEVQAKLGIKPETWKKHNS